MRSIAIFVREMCAAFEDGKKMQATRNEGADEGDQKDGGFPKVQGMGFFLDDKKLAQVSMNLLDFETTSIRTVFDKVKELASAQGVQVAESELIGLAPAAAIDAELAAHIQLPNFDAAASVVEAKLG